MGPDWIVALLLVLQVATGFMADEVGGCDALVHALLSVEPDIPNADDLILRAAVLTAYLAEQSSLRCEHALGVPFRFTFFVFSSLVSRRSARTPPCKEHVLDVLLLFLFLVFLCLITRRSAPTYTALIYYVLL